ncbi:hypothetical protein PGTUg99_031162 [Puccinia graminis f. sp. tritici]|uniref:50S ribosomal protein L35 n=1 Tax=Puccinia graminis f. sp. tritici TaxID=56615 RepID=A0A5B0LV70_PUCGR|nr:hypothetical protein PGTUg99_031162 [Puccinia graminis f. sp. tritici]
MILSPIYDLWCYLPFLAANCSHLCDKSACLCFPPNLRVISPKRRTHISNRNHQLHPPHHHHPPPSLTFYEHQRYYSLSENALSIQQLILRTIKPTLSSYRSVPLKPIHTFRIQQQQQQQQQRAFSISPSTHWKLIGTPKKNRKTRCKLKTHQGASKRFFVTGQGQFKGVQAGTQHLMTILSQTRKQKLKPMVIVKRSQTILLRKLLPHAGKRAGFRKLDQSETVWWRSGKLQKSGIALKQAIQRSHALRRSQLCSTLHLQL